MIEKELISGRVSECVHGSLLGYPPGPKYLDIIDGEDFGLLKLRTNGLAVITERQVFPAGGGQIDEIACPHCGADNTEADWADAIERWDKRQADNLQCGECRKEASIVDYIFRPFWGFGDLGLEFWNWPNLTPKFLSDLKEVMGCDIAVIRGRL